MHFYGRKEHWEWKTRSMGMPTSGGVNNNIVDGEQKHQSLIVKRFTCIH